MQIVLRQKKNAGNGPWRVNVAGLAKIVPPRRPQGKIKGLERPRLFLVPPEVAGMRILAFRLQVIASRYRRLHTQFRSQRCPPDRKKRFQFPRQTLFAASLSKVRRARVTNLPHTY